MSDVDPTALNAETFYVLVSATFGSGDVPANGQLFFNTLEDEAPDLSHVRFAVFGLGDRSFGETYNRGSEALMKQMLACRAQMVGERGKFDAATGDDPEDVAIPWLENVLDQLVLR